MLLNDCSITYATAAGMPYTVRMAVYFLITLIPIFWIAKNQIAFKAKRLASKKKDDFSLAEKLNYLNLIMVVTHCFATLADPLGYMDFPRVINAFLSSVTTFAAFTVVITLIRSWISIADGGKTSQEPTWCRNAGRYFQGQVLVLEVGLSVLEMIVVPDGAANYGGFNGSINGFKSFMMAIPIAFYMILCLKYAFKISASLKAGGSGGNDASKGIIKYCKIGVAGLFIGLLFKLMMTVTRLGLIIYTPPPCASSMIGMIDFIFWLASYGVVLAQLQNKKAAAVKPAASTTVSKESSGP